LLAAAAGCALAAVNYCLTKRAMEKNGALAGALSAVRMLLSAGLLAGVYFLAPHTPWDRIWMLVGAAAGLTVPMFFFTFLLVRRANAQKEAEERPDPEHKQGGESS
jgi:drug/metabolite transporter (DMT)-like permease